MKFLFTLILLLFQSVLIHSQCTTGINPREFQSIKSQLSTRNSYQNFQKAMEISKTSCLTANQAKELAGMLSTDRDKSDFLTSSYINIVDKDNFTDVMDVFKSLSMAFKLYHQTMGVTTSTPSIPIEPIYSGTKTCPLPMTVLEYNQQVGAIQNLQNDRLKASFILSNLQGKCILTQQMTAFSSKIGDENIRMDVLKRMIGSIYDIDRYGEAAQVLTGNNKTLFLQLLTNPNLSNNSQICPISTQEFNEFLKSVQKMSFDTDKTQQIRITLGQRCLTSGQIKELLSVSNYESSKVQIAKEMYDNCLDKSNYYKVNEGFKMSSSITELNEYIATKK